MRIYGKAVAMIVIVASAMLIMTCCTRKPVMAHARFVHLPTTGWQQSFPLTFIPQYDDSTLNYDLKLTVRHNNSYSYRNLTLAIDVFATDSTVLRQQVNLELADEYGNWTGGGFGALYQVSATIANGISPSQANRVVIWQTMAGNDTLQGLIDLGLTVFPNN